MKRSRLHPRAWVRRRPLRRVVAVAAAAVTLAAGVSAASAVPTSGVARSKAPIKAAVANTPALPSATKGLQAVAVPGLKAANYRVTLVTGDEVDLVRRGERYLIAAKPAPRADGNLPQIYVRVTHGAGGKVTGIQAVPQDAQAVVASGVVDAKLFDVLWLASHGGADQDGSLPVTLAYADSADSATLEKRADQLSAATVETTHPSRGEVDARVALGDAGGFWAAVKGDTSIGELTDYLVNGVVPDLGHGVTAMWPTGERTTKMSPDGDTTAPTYLVTRIVKNDSGVNGGCGATLCILGWPPDMVQVAGSAVGSGYSPTSVRCIDTSSLCSGWALTYQVPRGTYAGGGKMQFSRNGHFQYLDVSVPEAKVTGNTTISLDVANARKLSVTTPRPSEPLAVTVGVTRFFGNGQGGTVLAFANSASAEQWMFPSAPVTVGTFHLGENWVLAKPMVTMAVTKPTGFKLDAMMSGPFYRSHPLLSLARFSGQHQVALVDGGLGRAEDYDAINAKGKLVLLQIDDDFYPKRQCAMAADQLEMARAAGAIGVIVDPVSRGGVFPTASCVTPIGPDWSAGFEAPDLPFASVPHAQAQKLRMLMDDGPVRIDLSGYDSISPYLYSIQNYQEGRIPASLHTDVTNKQLAAVDEGFHGATPQRAEMVLGAFRPTTMIGVGIVTDLLDARRTTIYQGPVSPDLVRWRVYTPATPFSSEVIDLAEKAGPSSEQWTARPLVPGVPKLSTRVFSAQPGKWSGNFGRYCGFCRQGNTFYPMLFLTSGANPGAVTGPAVFAPENLHLYSGGVELPQTVRLGFGAKYELPAKKQSYRMTSKAIGASTTWNFTSTAPKAYQPPQGFICVDGAKIACQVDPLVFLRYDAGTDVNDAVTAGGKHQLKVTAYHQSSGAPAIKSLSLSVSTDHGATWTKVKVAAKGGGNYVGTYTVPSLSKTGGTVSLKASAKDAGGNSINQTVVDAFALKARS